MSYGLKIINSSNIVQIDSGFQNIHIIEHGVTEATNTASTGIATAAILGATARRIFVRPYSFGARFANCQTPTDYRLYSSTNMNYKYLIGDTLLPSDLPSSTYGLNIYKEDASIVFSSTRSLPKLVALNVAKFPVGNTVLTLPAMDGEKYISISSTLCFYSPSSTTEVFTFTMNSDTSLTVTNNYVSDQSYVSILIVALKGSELL